MATKVPLTQLLIEWPPRCVHICIRSIQNLQPCFDFATICDIWEFRGKEGLRSVCFLGESIIQKHPVIANHIIHPTMPPPNGWRGTPTIHLGMPRQWPFSGWRSQNPTMRDDNDDTPLSTNDGDRPPPQQQAMSAQHRQQDPPSAQPPLECQRVTSTHHQHYLFPFLDNAEWTLDGMLLCMIHMP